MFNNALLNIATYYFNTTRYIYSYSLLHESDSLQYCLMSTSLTAIWISFRIFLNPALI